MANFVELLYKAPEPTFDDPHAQIKWMFEQLESEHVEPYVSGIKWAKNTYIRFVIETNASHPELKKDNRFYLSRYWEHDALSNFNEWLISRNDITSKTRYGAHKIVRQVMRLAYSLRIIDTVVYNAALSKGVPETNQKSAYDSEEEELVNAAIARWVGLANSVLLGYKSTGKGIRFRPNKFELAPLVIDGKTYSANEATKHFGVSYKRISERMRTGWTAAQAVGVEPCPTFDKVENFEVEGVVYESLRAAGTRYGVSHRVISSRLRKGCSPEQSVGITPIYVPHKDERALLWLFENEFECDAKKMYDRIYREKWHLIPSYGCRLSRIRSLFMRWGVWPFIDDRLIMPLAAELAVVSGLNVEALKKLEIDSFQKQHRLTGQPVLTYAKNRSATSRRPAGRELHVPIIEEIFPDEKAAEQIEKLLSMVICLTAEIRKLAPANIANRLFIFEDVDHYYKTDTQKIVAIEPKGKVATWYNRFFAEERLEKAIGKKFRFTLSRCRPTLATNMVLAGATLFDVQVALGHADISTTGSYVQSRNLQPAFHRTISQALTALTERSAKEKEFADAASRIEAAKMDSDRDIFYETLSGCGCKNPFNPSKDVRAVTKYKEGTPCKNWNMCLRCDRAVVTEHSLPKLITYRRRLGVALETQSPAIQNRKGLFEDTIKLIDGILAEDVVFDAATLRLAEYRATTYNEILVDHLIYQGMQL
ncbi:tyrosine-type recombinase/integrase [Burkholderia cenocepacia]|uniref:tyrosine-type recombinase/integrase n=3 Tax=Burkholderia cenocepacia TaxID=95486 RepID=UPI0009AFCB10|nr:tyrosine-type recombinase/integrase [Burkholderia cenocepacia]MBR7977699.1 tyrosine-type recombinase/integrase [Burkholderia cenocepacia]MBR7992210.1 tyrosine-type recombinase/integrase [Burkholderia cenocepacia]